MGGRDISVNSCSHTAWFQEGELLVVGVDGWMDGYILSEVSYIDDPYHSSVRSGLIMVVS